MPSKLRLVNLETTSRLKRSQICPRCLHRVRPQTRSISNTISRHEEEVQGRWSYTPERLKAPISMNYEKSRIPWKVNESQERLDEFYVKLLGEGGDKLLTDEVKWLAVTHKTFEQGKRGYNDRLAFLGKRIMDLQASLALLNRTDGTFSYPPDPYKRKLFHHPGIDLLPRLTVSSRQFVTSPKRIADFAMAKGLLRLMRWKPRNPENLASSGVDAVLAGGIYAIVGAAAMQRGGEIATRIVQQRILPEIGLPQEES